MHPRVRPSTNRWLVLGAAVLLLAPLTGSPARAGTWSTPVDLSGEATDPGRLPALARDGDVTLAAWGFSDGSATLKDAVRVAERTGTAPWASATTLVAPRATPLSSDVRVASGGGHAVAVWVEGGSRIEMARRTAGGAWSVPVTVGSSTNVPVPRLAVLPDGRALIAWIGSIQEIRVVTIAADGTTSRPLELLRPDGSNLLDGFSLIADADGADFVLAIGWHDPGHYLQVDVVRVTPEGTPDTFGFCGGAIFPEITNLGTGFGFADDHLKGIAVAANGHNAAVAVGVQRDASTTVVATASCLSFATSWAEHTFTSGIPGDPQPTVGLVGERAVAAWRTTTGIAVTERALDAPLGDWSPVSELTTFSALGAADDAKLALQAAGDGDASALIALVVYRPGDQLLASFHETGSLAGWVADTPAPLVQPPGINPTGPAVVSTGVGRFTALWSNYGVAGQHAFTADVDVIPPVARIDSVSTRNVRYVASRLRGALGLHLTLPPDPVLVGEVWRADGSRRMLRRAIVAKASTALALPVSLPPGSYRLRITGTSAGVPLAPSEAPFAIAAPAEGIARAWLTAIRHATVGRSQIIGSQSVIYGYVAFSSRARGEVSAVWTPPGGRRLHAVRSAYRSRLEFQLGAPRGSSLAFGTWRLEIRARGKLVTTTRIRIVAA